MTDRDVLTAEELQSHPTATLLNAIKLLRPHWKGQVFMDGYPLGSMEELALVTADHANKVETSRR